MTFPIRRFIRYRLLCSDLLNRHRERNNYTNPLTDQALYALALATRILNMAFEHQLLDYIKILNNFNIILFLEKNILSYLLLQLLYSLSIIIIC